MSRAVRRCLHLLAELAAAADGLRFADCVALMPGAAESTVSRLLKAMEADGWIVHEDGRYRLGRTITPPSPALVQLEARRPLVESVLAEVAAAAGASAALMLRDGEMAMRIVATRALPRMPGYRPVGTIQPLYPFHGFAQAMLAWSPPPVQRACFERHRAEGERRPLGLRAYRERLARIRRDGWRIEDRDHYAHLVRVCVPVTVPGYRRADAVLGVIGGPGFAARARRVLPLVRRAAARLLAQWER